MKEEASKVKQTIIKAKQHSTSKAGTFPKTNELPRVGFEQPAFEYLRTLPSVLICPRLLRSTASSALPQDKNHFRGLPLQAPP